MIENESKTTTLHQSFSVFLPFAGPKFFIDLQVEFAEVEWIAVGFWPNRCRRSELAWWMQTAGLQRRAGAWMRRKWLGEFEETRNWEQWINLQWVCRVRWAEDGRGEGLVRFALLWVRQRGLPSFKLDFSTGVYVNSFACTRFQSQKYHLSSTIRDSNTKLTGTIYRLICDFKSPKSAFLPFNH